MAAHELKDLHEYQRTGVAWLKDRRTALLADEMGLGKTVQAIKAAEGQRKLLILAPTIALVNWQRELARWSRTKRTYAIFAKGSDTFGPHDSVITSYGMARRRLAVLAESSWDVAILDESHSINGQSKQAEAFWGNGGLLSRCARRWFLSGTPYVNNAGDLWSLLFCTGRTRLDYEAFVKRFCYTYTPGGYLKVGAVRPNRLQELQKLLGEVMLRRVKGEVGVQLPPITLQDVTLEPGDVDLDVLWPEWKYPFDKAQELFAQLDIEREILRKANPQDVKALELLAESLATLRRWTGLQKIEPVAQLVRSELEGGNYQKIVLFVYHRDVVEGLRSRLADHGVVTIYGGTPGPERQNAIDRFTKLPAVKVAVVNIQAARYAIDLTAADQAIVVEPVWTAEGMDQAVARLHRLTQKKPVTVRFATLLESTDQAVTAVFRAKGVDSRKLLAQSC